MMNMVCTIDVVAPCAGWARACRDAKSLARRAAEVAFHRGSPECGLARYGEAELSITLTDAAEQRRLNRDYRGLDVPTNVLAFRNWEARTRVPPGAPLLLGDVVLGLEIVLREAAEQDKPVADHLAHLVVHGVLHLLGYDHLTQIEADGMEALEISILAELGMPDPYRDAAVSAGCVPVRT